MDYNRNEWNQGYQLHGALGAGETIDIEVLALQHRRKALIALCAYSNHQDILLRHRRLILLCFPDFRFSSRESLAILPDPANRLRFGPLQRHPSGILAARRRF
jgi:hypothetical protein